MKICIVGSGVAGLAAAHYLSDQHSHEIVVFESAPVLGGRANVSDDGEHCTRIFLHDYHYLNDLLCKVPSVSGGSLLDSLVVAPRFARARDGRWVEINHIYAFLARGDGLSILDKVAISMSNRRSLLVAVDADRQKRREEIPGTGRWTIRLSRQGRITSATSSNRYASIWNWSPAGLYRALRSAGSSPGASVLVGCTERHLILPWVEYLRRRGVAISANRRVDRLGPEGDFVRVWSAEGSELFDIVIVTAFATDAYELLDRSGFPRILDHRRHTHCKAFTVDLDPREPVLGDSWPRIYASLGITTVVQPSEQRCVSMAAYPMSTEREYVLGIVGEQLSLVHPPIAVRERENLEPGEAVFVGDYVDPVSLAGQLAPRVQFAGSCMDNSYPVDSAEGACRSAYQAVERVAASFPEVCVRRPPSDGGPATRTPLFRATSRGRAHPNAPANSAMTRRLWQAGYHFCRAAVMLAATVQYRDRSGVSWPLGRPAVYVATHRSVFDVPVGILTFQRLAVLPRLVVAAKYFNHPLGSILRGIGALAAIRKSDATINAAVAALNCGESVAFMIEGKVVERTSADAAKYGRGAIEAALRAGAPIVPIAAGGTDRVWPADKRKPFLRLPRTPVRVAIGAPIEPTDSFQAIASRVREELQALEEYATGRSPDGKSDESVGLLS